MEKPSATTTTLKITKVAKGHGSLNSIIRQHDMSALTVLFVLVIIGAWPIAALLVLFGFIVSLFGKK